MKINVITLGCKVNQLDSEKFIKQCHKNGFNAFSGSVKDWADLYVINTCAVTSYAEKKSRGQVAKVLKTNSNAKIIIVGCASQNSKSQFANKSIIAVFGLEFEKDVIDVINKHFSHLKQSTSYKPETNLKPTYLKVQNGCNNFCSYCLVPYLRGREQDTPFEQTLQDIAQIESHTKEVIIVGINLSSYKNFANLFAALKDKPYKFRLSSMEVNIVTEEFMNLLKQNKNFIPHFHLSLQSGSDDVLKAMNRHYTTEEYFKKVQLIRKHFKNAVLTTDIICGFPTETELHFNQTLEFVKKVNFSDAHVFQYSPRAGTPAAKLKPITQGIVTKRAEILANAIKLK